MKKPKVQRTAQSTEPPKLTEPHQPTPWTWGIPAPGPYPRPRKGPYSEQGGAEHVKGDPPPDYPPPKPHPNPPPNLGRVPTIQDAAGYTVCNLFGLAGLANAELIVTAVNAWLAQKTVLEGTAPNGDRGGAGFDD